MIPYEAQSDLQGCGAASLVMVFRSFGLDACQEGIRNRKDRSRRARWLAAHVREHGLQAAIVRFREPWEGLLAVRNELPDCRVILNHRLLNEMNCGHFSVLVDLLPERDIITVHDPLFGPNRRWTKETLSSLWEKGGGEILGKVAILIRRAVPATVLPATCEHCGEEMDLAAFHEMLPELETVFCPRCDRASGTST